MISFTKHTGHHGSDDVTYINIQTEAVTLQEYEEAFQSFLKAIGFQLDEIAYKEED